MKRKKKLPLPRRIETRESWSDGKLDLIVAGSTERCGGLESYEPVAEDVRPDIANEIMRLWNEHHGKDGDQ